MNETAAQRYRLKYYYQRLIPLFKSSQTQAYIMVTMSIITIAFFSFFAIKPTLHTITVLQKQISDKTEFNAKLDEKINALILSQQEYEKIETLLPTVYSLMPDKPEAPLLIRYLENLSLDKQVVLSQMTTSPLTLFQLKTESSTPSANQPDISQVNPISLSIRISGGYQNVLNFIDAIAKLNRLISISSVNINLAGVNTETPGAQTASADLGIDISSRTYYYAQGL